MLIIRVLKKCILFMKNPKQPKFFHLHQVGISFHDAVKWQ